MGITKEINAITKIVFDMDKIPQFTDSVKEFDVISKDDVQRERLRKIHTFQASLDDLVAYVNQRIYDTKKG